MNVHEKPQASILLEVDLSVCPRATTKTTTSTYEGSTMPQQEDFSTVTSMTEQETMEKS